jgi:hypothetical protein
MGECSQKMLWSEFMQEIICIKHRKGCYTGEKS